MSQTTIPGIEAPEQPENDKITAQDVIKTWSEIYKSKWKVPYSVLPKDGPAAKRIAKYFKDRPWKLYSFLRESMDFLNQDKYWTKNLCLAAIPCNVNSILRSARVRQQRQKREEALMMPTAGMVMAKQMQDIADEPNNGIAAVEMQKIRKILRRG